jgi:hypothetical protein
MSKEPKKELTTEELILSISRAAFDSMLNQFPDFFDDDIPKVLDHIEEALAKPETDITDVFLYPNVILCLCLWANDSDFSVVSYPEIFAFNTRCANLLNRVHQRIYDDDEP